MEITCPNGHVNEAANRFCDQCGAPLAAQPVAAAAATPAAPVGTSGDASSTACPVCGQENLPGTAFCENCGAQLPPPAPTTAEPAAPISTTMNNVAAGPVCPNCGYQNAPNDRFCDQCGAALDSATAPADEATSSATSPAPIDADADLSAPVDVITTIDASDPSDASDVAARPLDAALGDATASAADPGGLAAQAAPADEDLPDAPAFETPALDASAAPAAPSAEETIAPVIAAPDQPSPFAAPPAALAAPSSAATCVSCGAELPPNAKFCLECGTKVEIKPALIRPTHCVSCGAELPPNAKFCLECGTKVDLVAASGSGTPGSAPVAASSAAPVASAPTTPATPGEAAFIPVQQPSAAPVQPAAPSTPPTPATSGVRTYTTQGTGARLVASDGSVLALQAQGESVIGRDDPISGIHPDVDLTTQGGEAGGVSRRHATIQEQAGQWSVTDLDSTNYTRVNGQRIQPHTPTPIQDGAKVQFGRLEFEFKL